MQPLRPPRLRLASNNSSPISGLKIGPSVSRRKTGWSSSGQLAKRFDIARAIGNGNNQLFTPAGSSTRTGGFPMLTTRLYYDAIEPYLSPATHDALAKATSQQEWNSFLLASPDLNYR